MSIIDKLEKIKQTIPPTNGNIEEVTQIQKCVKDTFNLLRILMTEHAGYPVMEDVTEEIRRYKERWGNGTHC